MGNLEKLNEFLQKNYFFLILEKDSNMKSILLEKLTKYVIITKAKAMAES